MPHAIPAAFRTLDLNLLRVFDEVMAERSLTKAARNLSITQPAVSNALRRLRETLGDDLVRREGHGITPTPFALTLWPNVREALDQLQSALVPQHFVPSQARNSFVLAMADATAAELMGGLAQELEHHAPNISIRVLPLTTRDPRALLENEGVDMALGYFPAVLADLTARAQGGEAMAFEHHRLYDGEYVCDAQRSSLGTREHQLGKFLQCAPLVGELFRQALRFHRRSFGIDWQTTTCSDDRQSIFHSGPHGGEL
jgi:DNA-binding transcriptional LysR family regulator